MTRTTTATDEKKPAARTDPPHNVSQDSATATLDSDTDVTDNTNIIGGSVPISTSPVACELLP